MAQSASDGPQSVSECWYRVTIQMGKSPSVRYVTGVTEKDRTFTAIDHQGRQREWSKSLPFIKTQLGGRSELPPKIREELNNAE
jgi:hypothetical protein